MARAARIGTDGWVSVHLDAELTVHVKAGRDPSGRVVITDLLVSAPEVTTDVLRQIHPRQMLNVVFSNVTGNDMVESVAGTDDSKTTLGDLRSRGAAVMEGESHVVTMTPARRKPLGRPTAEDGEVFYKAVARAYRSAAAESSRPAMALADENDVPVETVRRWIKEARRRGHLAPGTKGRAG